MPLEHTPQQGQQSFVRQDGLPGRLDEPDAACGQARPERFIHEPFPWIQFDQGRDDPFIEIGELSPVIDADIFNCQEARLKSGFLRALLKVFERPFIVLDILVAREVGQPLDTQKRECLHDALMEVVELIAPFGDQTLVHGLFKPFPLEHRRFIKRCRRVRIVLKQFRRTLATIGNVHSPVEISVLIAPAFGDIIPK